LEILARWRLADTVGPRIPFATQDRVLTATARVTADPRFLELTNGFYLTKVAQVDVRLAAWCTPEGTGELTGLIAELADPCSIIEMDTNPEAGLCHPSYGRPEQEPIFRAYLRQVSEMAVELLAADAAQTKNLAIKSKYLDDPRGLLAPHFRETSPRYRALDPASEQLFWRLFRTRETDTPWSHFFYNLTLGIDWAPEQMTESEATRLLIPEGRPPGQRATANNLRR
jgi:hypothetical protein